MRFASFPGDLALLTVLSMLVLGPLLLTEDVRAQAPEGALGLTPTPRASGGAQVAPAPTELPPPWTPPAPPARTDPIPPSYVAPLPVPYAPPSPQAVPPYPGPESRWTPTPYGGYLAPVAYEGLPRLRRLARNERILLATSGFGLLGYGVGFAGMFGSGCFWYDGGDCPGFITLFAIGTTAFVGGTLGGSIVAIRGSRELARAGLPPRRGLAILALVGTLSLYGTVFAPIPLALHSRHMRRTIDRLGGAQPSPRPTFALATDIDREHGRYRLLLTGTF